MANKYTNSNIERIKQETDFVESNPSIADVINAIDEIYSEYNKDIDIYTQNYKDTMESAFDSFAYDSRIFSYKSYCEVPGETQGQFIKNLHQYKKKLQELEYLKFLSEEKKTVVFVGTNGCGKTTLLRKLRAITGEEKIGYYQADRLMVVDENYNPQRDYDAFISSCNHTDYVSNNIEDSYQINSIILQFNQIVALFERRRTYELELHMRGELESENLLTEKVLKAWNGLIKDRVLYNEKMLSIKTTDGQYYPIKYMSSGEKSIFYFLASILLKERKAYYFIDEPENNLNPSVVSKLWDIIEENCPDSTFVYLTHDSNFVSSRLNSKTYWIKNFDGKIWDYEALPENDNLPQSLMIELVGSREPILFCESHDEYKYDDIFYKQMFPDYKIVPAGGCVSVRDKVAAYKRAGLPETAIGIIDCDYRNDDELDRLEEKSVYHCPFFEIENFLFCEELVRAVIERFSMDPECAFSSLKSRLKDDFEHDKERIATKMTAFRLINKSFNKAINSIKTIDELKSQYDNYKEEINIQAIYSDSLNTINKAVISNDFNTMLRYYDNKGILTRYNAILKLKNKMPYDEALFILIKENKTILESLRSRYFPSITLG